MGRLRGVERGNLAFLRRPELALLGRHAVGHVATVAECVPAVTDTKTVVLTGSNILNFNTNMRFEFLCTNCANRFCAKLNSQ